MVQRTYYAPPEPDAPVVGPSAGEPAPRGVTEIRYGYTLADLESMTRAAVVADRSMAMDIRDRRDIAWSAIAEALWTAETPPHRQDLIRTGWQAIYRAVREEYRQHGYADREQASGHASAPRFVEYWYTPVAASHEERIVERLAIRQVLAPLGQTYRDAVLALAVHGEYRAAAESMDLKRQAFSFRISRARRDTLARWFEGETPRQVRSTDRRVSSYTQSDCCPQGHEYTPENTIVARRIVRGTLRTSRRCRACQRDRDAARRGRGAAA